MQSSETESEFEVWQSPLCRVELLPQVRETRFADAHGVGGDLTGKAINLKDFDRCSASCYGT